MKHVIYTGMIIILLLIIGMGVQANPINPQDVTEKINNSSSAVVFDIRDAASFYKGHLQNAVNIAWKDNALDSKYKESVKSTGTTIIVVCQDGTQSKQAVEFLKAAGYQQSYYITGGMDACTNILSIEQNNTNTWGVIKALFGGQAVPRQKG